MNYFLTKFADIMNGKRNQCMGVIFILINRLKTLNLVKFDEQPTYKSHSEDKHVHSESPDNSVPKQNEESTKPSIRPLVKTVARSNLNQKPKLESTKGVLNDEFLDKNEESIILIQNAIRNFFNRRKRFKEIIDTISSNKTYLQGITRLQALYRSKVVWDSLRPKRRRTEIAKEILTTEESYIRSLRILVNVYMKTLESLGDDVVPPIKIRTIFSEIKVILSYNEIIHKDIRERMNNWYSEGQRLGDIFLRLTDFLKVYTAYVNNYNDAINTIQQLSQNPVFAKTLISCRDNPETGGHELQSYLIMPIQRIPRYVLLLTDLFKSTPEGHPDYEDLSKALKKMEDVAKYVNQKKKEAENLLGVTTVLNHLTGMDDAAEFNQPHRRYVRQGFLFEGDGGVLSQKGLKPRYYFLFNDCIICAKESTNILGKRKTITMSLDLDGLRNSEIEFKFVYLENLLGALLQEVTLEGNKNLSSFEIKFPSGRHIILTSTSIENRDDWIQDIDETIMSCLEKRRSRMDIQPDEEKKFEVPVEKHLTSGDFKGYLYQLGQKGVWKKRYYILINDVLYCYKDEKHVGNQEQLKETIYLLQSSVQFLSVMDRPHCFQLLTKTRIYHLSASTNKERLDWIFHVRNNTTKHMDEIDLKAHTSSTASINLNLSSNVANIISGNETKTSKKDGDTKRHRSKTVKETKEEESLPQKKEDDSEKDEESPKKKTGTRKKIGQSKRKKSIGKTKSSLTRTIKTGELFKVSSSGSKTTKYTFTLKGNEILYFRAGRTKPSGNISLLLIQSVDKEITPVQIKGSNLYKFTIVTSDEKFILASSEEEDAKEWSREIKRATKSLKSM